MERKLLLLGLLRQHEMYGYQIIDLIDTHLGTSIHLTKPTAYRILYQMGEDGWVSSREEQAGNRPIRRMFAITPKGETQFQELLRKCLSEYKPAQRVSAISLAFLDVLPPDEIINLLQKRLMAIETLLTSKAADEIPPGGFLLIIENQYRHLATELEWLRDVITRIQ